MIRKYVHEDIGENPDCWRKVINRTPFEIVKNLAIASGQFYKHYQKGRNWSLLHIAAHSGDLQSCMGILEKLKMKDLKSKNGSTPFHSAASGGNKEIYQYLVRHAKEINPADIFGFTPLHVASHLGHFDICKFIIDNADEKNPAANDGLHHFTRLARRVTMIFANSLLTMWTTKTLQTMMDSHHFT